MPVVRFTSTEAALVLVVKWSELPESRALSILSRTDGIRSAYLDRVARHYAARRAAGEIPAAPGVPAHAIPELRRQAAIWRGRAGGFCPSAAARVVLARIELDIARATLGAP